MNTKRIILWMAGTIAVLTLFAVIAGIVLFNHSQRFRAYLLQQAQRSVNVSTGARMEVRDFKVHFSKLQLDLYGVVIHGKEPDSRKPLLTADHIGGTIKIDSVLRRKWSLRSLTARTIRSQVSIRLPSSRQHPLGRTTSFSDFTPLVVALTCALLPSKVQSAVVLFGPAAMVTVYRVGSGSSARAYVATA